jgi:hypothetical protein
LYFILCYLAGSYGTGSAEVDFDSPVEAKLAWLQVRSWLLIFLAWGISTLGLALLVRCKLFPSVMYALWILAGNGAVPAWINSLTEAELHVDQAAHEAMYDDRCRPVLESCTRRSGGIKIIFGAHLALIIIPLSALMRVCCLLLSQSSRENRSGICTSSADFVSRILR